MRSFYFGLMLYTISFNQAHANVSWIEQKFTPALMVSEQDTTLEELFNDINGNEIYDLTEPFTDRNNNNQYDYAEDFIDVNRNGEYDYQENYQDYNQNGIWDNAEPYTDLNNNGFFNNEEPFKDQGNGAYDLGEDFIDVNNNNIWDANLWYVDRNNNKKWDDGESFEDLNNNHKRDFNENYTDNNNNYRYDGPEEIGDSKFNYFAEEFIEPYTDTPNGRYDLGEKFEDLNGDGQWTAAEEYEDLNGDGQWTASEEYEDLNGDGQWTAAEEYEDLNGDGQWTAAEEYEDKNKNGIRDKVETESIIYDTLMTSGQDITIEEKPGARLKPYKSSGSFKSPGKALLYSGVLPGMGQAYMRNWMRALLFVAIDGVAIGTWYHNNNLAEERKKEYSYFSNDHWDFGRWVHDYYKWYEYKEGNDEWNAIRKVFINYSDSTSGCAQDPTKGQCYTDIWDHSHKVEFTYDGSIISSSSEEFKEVFQELCDNSNIWDTECSNEVVSLYDNNNDTILVIKNHHFYEGIQKYDMYFAGWDDNDEVELVIKPNSDKNATSPNQKIYRNLWGDYNTVKTLAVNGGKFMLFNRMVSMIDALLLAKKWNNEHGVKLSLNAYPDLRNKSGVGGVKLSLRWK